MRRRLMTLATLFVGAALIAGLLISGPAAAVATTAPGPLPAWGTRPEPALAGPTITISNFQFTPRVLRVKAGAEVTWQVKEGAHTVSADDGSFTSPTLSAGQKFNHTFSKPGTYRYYCSFHGSKGGHDMAGTVVVAR